MSMLALDKWARLIKIISQHGGPIKSFGKIWRMDTLKEGKYMGTDCYGNRYFENKNYMISRSRWVEYNPQFKWEYDASQVSREWFGWLHYKTDRLPSEDWAKYCLNCCCWCHRWLLPHMENLSGTEYSYYPYTTTRPNIYVWDDGALELIHSTCSKKNRFVLGTCPAYSANFYFELLVKVAEKIENWIVMKEKSLLDKLRRRKIGGHQHKSYSDHNNYYATVIAILTVLLLKNIKFRGARI